DSSISHINSNNKTNISALWVAPASHARVLFSQNEFVGTMTILNKEDPNSTAPLTTPGSTSTSAILTSISPPTHISRDTCGTQKICLSSPSDCDPSKTTNCHFMSSTKTSNGGYHFEISGPAAGYVAFGFSDDQFMGNDDIYICGINATGQVHIQHAYAEGRRRPQILTLTNVEASLLSYSGGVIQCTFSSTNQISTQQPVLQSRSSNSSDVYYVLVCYGPSLNGALMLIAWMTTGSLGMALARYFKVAAQKLFFGKAFWFQNAITHAVIGCIVIGLTFVQPFIAFFRPSPENSKRFIFNWFHRINASVIKVLAVANLFLGLQLIDHKNGWMVEVMGGFVGWWVLFLIVFEINATLAKKGKKKSADKENTQASAKYEIPLLFLYLCGNLAFLITLLVGISQS
ncbi:PREDICTED: putative ferric-chelate reductase 1, partial [Nanorana parkeri]|uniref:putative ferric-chelate reductase 1 n=1 Tax=Nanorana parkeri TaxID=125878 RepID=UPI0008547663